MNIKMRFEREKLKFLSGLRNCRDIKKLRKCVNGEENN